MSDERLARALLRLYPRSWRERYGDEFLALVDQSGLTWREAADVVLAAGLERGRTTLALAFADVDPELGQHTSSRQIAAGFGDLAAHFAVVGAAVLAFGAAGVSYPGWMFWYWIFNQWHFRGLPVTVGDWLDRLLASSFWFFIALALTAGCWLTADALHRLGVQPSERVLNRLFVVGVVSVILRIGYGIYRRMSSGRAKGVAHREVAAWNGLAFVLVVLAFLDDPSTKGFWIYTGSFWMTVRLPFGLTPAGALLSQQRHDAVFGEEALSKFPRY